MKKFLRPVGIAAIALGLIGTACTSSNNFRDVRGVASHDADKYYVFNNVDKNPNITVVCIRGVAFVTTTRDYNAIMRTPDLDKMC